MPSDPLAAVSWPALLHYAGKEELGYVRDADEWQLDPDLHAWPYGPADRLIDSDGRVFRLEFAGAGGPGRSSPSATADKVSMDAVLSLALGHLNARGIPAALLSAHLDGYPIAHRLRALVRYVGRHESGEAAEDVAE
jgi:hypothetical protein